MLSGPVHLILQGTPMRHGPCVTLVTGETVDRGPVTSHEASLPPSPVLPPARMRAYRSSSPGGDPRRYFRTRFLVHIP